MGFKCETCGKDLDGGEYVSAWEDGDNAEAYVICPHCHCKNVMCGWEGDD